MKFTIGFCSSSPPHVSLSFSDLCALPQVRTWYMSGCHTCDPSEGRRELWANSSRIPGVREGGTERNELLATFSRLHLISSISG